MKKHSEMYDSARPYIACFVLLRKDNMVAMVLRKNTSWMNGFWGLPAGKVEYGEPYINGAIREAKEEAGVDIDRQDLAFLHIAHRHSEDGNEIMDWIDVYFEAKHWRGEPYNAEEEKSERLEWHKLDNLPENVVPSQKAVLLQIAKGEVYSEYGWE